MSDPDGRRELVVDGETFRIHTTDDGTTHCDWVTGPNRGYGFSMGAPARFVPEGQEPPPDDVLTDDVLIRSIRDFISRVDPETGYLD